MAHFSDRLKLLRREHNLSQMELARQLGCVSKSSVNMYERGEREPSFETLEAIADYFNVDLDYLLGKSDIRNPEKAKEDPLGLAKVGFSMDKYTPPTDAQREQIKGLLEVILKDNKKENE